MSKFWNISMMLLVVGVLAIACSPDPEPLSPHEGVARAFITAASNGNLQQMHELSAGGYEYDNMNTQFIIDNVQGIPVDDLTFQYDGNANYGGLNAHLYHVYHGKTQVAHMRISQIGDAFFVISAGM